MVGIVGYDPGLVARLEARHARFFNGATILTIVAALGGGVGAAYGMSLAFGVVVGVVVGIGFAAFMLNLVRLVHAGSGYPVHLPIDDIDNWSPTATSALVLGFLGLLMSQPLVLLIMAPTFHIKGGLIAQVNAVWSQHGWVALGLTVMLATIVSAPGWLRLIGADSVRAYEKERWIDDRMFVDDAFANGQEAITNLLVPVPGFSGTLAVHYADPPYNTRPLIYGLDPSVVVSGGVKFVKTKEPPMQTPAEPVASPVEAKPAPPPPPKPAPAPVELPPPPKVAGGDDDVKLAWDDTSHDNDTEAPPLAFFDVGRLQAKRAKEHMDLVAPFVAKFTGMPEEHARGLIRAAPDDMRVHKLFGDYKKLKSILLKDAAFALDHGMAPILSIIVQRPVADVERRLKAAPRDKRLTGVFAPELARRILKKNVPGSA